MKYYIIAGEASGDLHASNLIREIRKLDATAEFRCWGGDLMEKQGAVVVKHYRDLAFMGFLEVLANLSTILGNLTFCKRDIIDYKPDALILVDYPGFNLRIARFAHSLKIPVIYYISPQLWAWKQSRIKTIRRSVDKMIVILPFEKSYYAQHGVEVEFSGHPLLDALAEKTASPVFPANGKKLVALLPGSRRQEIRKVLPVMLSVTRDFPEVDFAIAGVSTLGEEFYKELMPDSAIPVVMNRTYDLLKQSSAALVTSGTATLETALIGTPEVVCYKGGMISYLIARQVIKVKYISLVNLIMDKLIVRELIQGELNRQNLMTELNLLLNDTAYRTKMIVEFDRLRELLGGTGASAKAAFAVVNFLAR
ncbi:MAG: lipid-A-disaccharide synthase [Bacteroidetes bacterium]|nr:MAG: lipid-A-disaccharide synthase [Bacteroidota bacterium]